MSQKIEIAYIILQYNTFELTKNCVLSIKEKQEQNPEINYSIVIVDNASFDEIGIKTKKTFENDQRIHVLVSDKNLGFAKGNNLGIKYARENLDARFIILLNNDILLYSDCFAQKIIENYEKSKSGILSPLILSGDGRYTSNPQRKSLPPVMTYQIKHFIICIKYILSKFGLLGLLLERLFDILVRLLKVIRKNLFHEGVESLDFIGRKDYYLKEHIGIVPHGCFLILTPTYFKKFDGLYDKTFLYGEEDILAFLCYKNQVEIKYVPSLCVFHYEGASSGHKGSHKNRFYHYKYERASSKILLDLMEKE